MSKPRQTREDRYIDADKKRIFNNIIVMVQFCPNFYLPSIHRRRKGRKRIGEGEAKEKRIEEYFT